MKITAICKNQHPTLATQKARRSLWKLNAKQAVQSGLTVITTATVSLIIAKWEGNVHELR